MLDCKESQETKMDYRLTWNRRQSQFSNKMAESVESSDYRSSAQQRHDAKGVNASSPSQSLESSNTVAQNCRTNELIKRSIQYSDKRKSNSEASVT